MSLNPIQPSASVGSIYNKTKREQYAPVQGETCSLIDKVFRDTTSQQKGLEHYIYENPLDVSILPDPKLVISKYREMIKEHVERKTLFFLQQLIVCHRTGLYFKSAGARMQGESALAIYMNVNDHQEKYVPRQAAHSSSNPCLIAYDNIQPKGSKIKSGGSVFLEGTDYYRTMNATMNMPKWINDADREIDEKTKNSQLRQKGEDLINLSSQGLITPDEGMLEYIKEALDEVRAAKQRLAKEGRHLEVQEVLAYYEEDLTGIQKYISAEPRFLEKFLSIKMESAQNEQSKRALLHERYITIRDSQINQFKLIKKINELKEQILTQFKARNKGKKPDYFDAAFKTKIVHSARTDEDRIRLEKLLNYSSFNFEAQIQVSAKAKYENTKKMFSSYDSEIESLVGKILQDMIKLRIEEMGG